MDDYRETLKRLVRDIAEHRGAQEVLDVAISMMTDRELGTLLRTLLPEAARDA